MKKGKAGLPLFLLAVVLLGFFLLHSELNKSTNRQNSSYETYDRHYAMITDNADSELWDRVYESALEEGKSKNVYVERFGNNLAIDYDRNQLLELAISASVDGIIVTGDEDPETVRLIDTAVEQGIPVVTVLRDSSGSRRQCFVGSNSYNVGQEYGRQILKYLEEGQVTVPAKVLVLMDESRLDTSQNLILLGIRETLERGLGKDHPVVVETAPVDNTKNFGSEESIRDIFLNTEQLPDILVCLDEVHTQCAYQAAVDYNKVGSMRIFGYFDSDTILDAVAKNIIDSTITLDTTQMGQLCVNALEEYVETGYTNSYMAVDIRLINAAEAQRLLEEE